MSEAETAFREFFVSLELESKNNPKITKHEDYVAFIQNRNTLKTGYIDSYSEEDMEPLFAEYRKKLENLNLLQPFPQALRLFETYYELAKQ